MPIKKRVLTPRLDDILNPFGNIYLIASESQQAAKIGFCSGPPIERLMKLQTGNPTRLKLLKSIRGTLRVEQALHDCLKPYKIINEWFSDPEYLFLIFCALEEEAIDSDDVEGVIDISAIPRLVAEAYEEHVRPE